MIIGNFGVMSTTAMLVDSYVFLPNYRFVKLSNWKAYKAAKSKTHRPCLYCDLHQIHLVRVKQNLVVRALISPLLDHESPRNSGVLQRAKMVHFGVLRVRLAALRFMGYQQLWILEAALNELNEEESVDVKVKVA